MVVHVYELFQTHEKVQLQNLSKRESLGINGKSNTY